MIECFGFFSVDLGSGLGFFDDGGMGGSMGEEGGGSSAEEVYSGFILRLNENYQHRSQEILIEFRD